MIMYLSKALNSASAVVSFSASRSQNLEAMGGSVEEALVASREF